MMFILEDCSAACSRHAQGIRISGGETGTAGINVDTPSLRETRGGSDGSQKPEAYDLGESVSSQMKEYPAFEQVYRQVTSTDMMSTTIGELQECGGE
jgi:hypothetical protein